MATIVLRKNNLSKLMRTAQITTDRELAARMHVDPATVHRTVRGVAAPGAKFIAGLLEVFGVDWFGDLFEVIPSSQDGTEDAA